LFQLLVPQALNSSLLASPQSRWAPLSYLPDIFTLLFFMIDPLLISISFLRAIINLIYFYAPTIIRTYPSNSFMDGSAIDSILPILSVFVITFRIIVQRGELQTLIPAVSEECTPQCARPCSRACSSSSLLRASSSNLRFSSSYFCCW
jgi:hypothetical protein